MPARTPAFAAGAERIRLFILVIRRQRVLLDEDLAALYGVETRVLLQAVKRNPERFPSDFMFELSAAEWTALRS
jgi:ORF6N domain